MDPQSRRLLKVQIEDGIAADENLHQADGDDVEPRRLFNRAECTGRAARRLSGYRGLTPPLVSRSPGRAGKPVFHSRSASAFRRGFFGVVGFCRRARFCRARRKSKPTLPSAARTRNAENGLAFGENEPMQKIGFSVAAVSLSPRASIRSAADHTAGAKVAGRVGFGAVLTDVAIGCSNHAAAALSDRDRAESAPKNPPCRGVTIRLAPEVELGRETRA